MAFIGTLSIYAYRGETIIEALISASSSAAAIFLSWAVGRELDPANDWSAFLALPVVYYAFFTIGNPSLLVLFFIILCCRLLNRICGMQPLRSDALLLFVMGILLYFNNFYFALLYLVLIFLIDALIKPIDRFQFISALVSSAAYLIIFLAYRPEFVSLFTDTMPTVYPAVAVIMVVSSVVYISYVTRHDRVIDDLNKAEVDYHRVNAARFLAAAWIVNEILCGGVIMLLQVYPIVFIFGGIFLYHFTRNMIKKPT